MKEIAEVKSLRWICNQIPDNLGNSNEERMLKAIKEYCKCGADMIEELAKMLYRDGYRKDDGQDIMQKCEDKLPKCAPIVAWEFSKNDTPFIAVYTNRDDGTYIEIMSRRDSGYFALNDYRRQSDTLREFACWLNKEADKYDFIMPYEFYLAIRAKLKEYGVKKEEL